MVVVPGYFVVKELRSADTCRVVTFQVPGGWGYKIKIKGKVFINQPFIPVFPGKNPFPNKRSAKKVGTIVKEKLIHHQRPALTAEDIRKTGLDSSGHLK